MARASLLAFVLTLFSLSSHAQSDVTSSTDVVKSTPSAGVEKTINFLKDIDPLNEDGTINVVIEIPAGSLEKWEVTKASGALVWEQQDGNPRRIDYLPYPANYGMVPQTLVPKSKGGDGDPLDVMVLGPSHKRGEVVPARILTVLNLIDRGEMDRKIIAVDVNSHFSSVQNLGQLDKKFNGVSEIIETWFKNYKGLGAIVSRGYRPKSAALKTLKAALDGYAK